MVGLLDTTVYYPDLVPGLRLATSRWRCLSGAVVAGVGAWALTRALGQDRRAVTVGLRPDGRRV